MADVPHLRAARHPVAAVVLAAALAPAKDGPLMLVLGILLVYGGYGVGSWGYINVKGYNITLREWFSPLHPFTGKLDSNGTVPPGSIFPTSGKGAKAAPGSNAAPPTANRNQGQVSSRFT